MIPQETSSLAIGAVGHHRRLRFRAGDARGADCRAFFAPAGPPELDVIARLPGGRGVVADAKRIAYGVHGGRVAAMESHLHVIKKDSRNPCWNIPLRVMVTITGWRYRGTRRRQGVTDTAPVQDNGDG